jgi:hypothetical protein
MTTDLFAYLLGSFEALTAQYANSSSALDDIMSQLQDKCAWNSMISTMAEKLDGIRFKCSFKEGIQSMSDEQLCELKATEFADKAEAELAAREKRRQVRTAFDQDDPTVKDTAY